VNDNNIVVSLSVLSQNEWDRCAASEVVGLGSYFGWRERDCPFTIEIDAHPLAILAESAARGYRVYEFMSLHRPAGVLRYLSARMANVHPTIQERVNTDLKQRYRFFREADRPVFTLYDFDQLFFLQGDDTQPEDQAWIGFKEQPEWNKRLSRYFSLVATWQKRLRKKDDFLIQRELGLIAAHEHRQDFLSVVPFDAFAMAVPPDKSVLPPALFNLVRDLILKEQVQSVSCELKDFPLWRLLVSQQVQRAEKASLPPQSAFGLCGPEGRAPNFVAAEDWGGYVHHPYEGVVPCDIYFLPHWRNFSFGSMKSTCKYLLTQQDFGEKECASRTVFDDWFLYEYKGEYASRNPFVSHE
jgi:hypothetical protein